MDRLTLESCEEIYLSGNADQVSGDVEASTGHFYRVGHCIVETDNQGFKDFTEYESEDEAIEAFLELQEDFGDWATDEDREHE